MLGGSPKNRSMCNNHMTKQKFIVMTIGLLGFHAVAGCHLLAEILRPSLVLMLVGNTDPSLEPSQFCSCPRDIPNECYKIDDIAALLGVSHLLEFQTDSNQSFVALTIHVLQVSWVMVKTSLKIAWFLYFTDSHLEVLPGTHQSACNRSNGRPGRERAGRISQRDMVMVLEWEIIIYKSSEP